LPAPADSALAPGELGLWIFWPQASHTLKPHTFKPRIHKPCLRVTYITETFGQNTIWEGFDLVDREKKIIPVKLKQLFTFRPFALSFYLSLDQGRIEQNTQKISFWRADTSQTVYKVYLQLGEIGGSLDGVWETAFKPQILTL
jgi:hypothetical protein